MSSTSRRTANLGPVADDDSGFSSPFNTALAIQASTLLANDTDANGDPLVITGVGNAVNGTVAFDSQTNVVTFTPTSGYSGTASFTYTISDGNGGTDYGPGVAQRRRRRRHAEPVCASATPATVTVNDSSDVELGMKFQADVAGLITGIRFYKGPEQYRPA